ncbi:pilus assembly protein [Pseudomonas linyingensis]|nr:PilC/PilY family type IV pilus protein [Pseudomonas linyingensis]
MGFLLLLALPGVGQAEDIDIFVGGQTDSSLPNVIFVLDNTSNWARQSQQWPGGIQQGQAEVRAIRDALSGLTEKVNVGIVEFTTQGTANQDGGYVRFDLQKLTTTSQATLNSRLDAIYADINGPTEKRNSGTPYGNLMRDVYNYLGGLAVTHDGVGTATTLADSGAYEIMPSKFSSPLSQDNLCSPTYLIFIGNPNSNGPSTDSSANSTALRELYAAVNSTPDRLAGDGSGVPLPLPEINSYEVTDDVASLGFTEKTGGQCYSVGKNSTGLSDCNADVSAVGGMCWDAAGNELLSNCACNADNTSSAGCNGQTVNFEVRQAKITTINEPTGQQDTVSGGDWNLDDWSKFLFNHGVPVTLTYTVVDTEVVDGEMVETERSVTDSTRHSVITYAIDVYNKQPNADHTALLYSASQEVGGGRYFAATSADEIKAAIESVLSDILSISTTYAAVTLPLSATNRAQNENQVFIGMFRPDQKARPRWFGNLKRYQVGMFANNLIELADANGNQAVNPQTGFAAECAESFWTVHSDAYWEGLGITPAPRSQCLSSLNSVWSDLPDGPFVEKGGVAQEIRRRTSDRLIKTVSGTSLVNLTSAAIGGDTYYNYFIGSQGGLTDTGTTEVLGSDGKRPSIHGDVIHSRPLPVNYGGTIGTVVYYGANDGLFRAVKSSNGEELWALLAPEHLSQSDEEGVEYDTIKRLHDNSPKVSFPGKEYAEDDAEPLPKDYFFDGPVGQYVTYNNTSNQVDLAYIYPTMRRGGRMLYALNVTTPDSPSLLWRKGCPSLDNDTDCDAGFAGIGQIWSTPRTGKLAGYAGDPVIIFGGGYDTCEDTDHVNTTCSAKGDAYKGRGIYVLNARTGALIESFATDNAVVSDVNTVDVDFDGKIDYAYAADTGGNIWRVSFPAPVVPESGTPEDNVDDWSIAKIAFTSGDGRRFMNTPTLLALTDSGNDYVYLALGSGNRERPLESNYPYTTNAPNGVDDRFYVLRDQPGAAAAAVDLDDTEGSDGFMIDATTEPACDATGIYPGGAKKGWFMSMPGRGEQIVNPGAIAGGDVLFNSYRPGGTQVGMCSRPLGVATAYQMSLFNGSACGRQRSEEIAGGGMPIAPTISTVNIKVDPDCQGTACETVTETICIGCKGLKPTPIVPTINDSRKRVYWSSDIDR